MIWAWIIPGAVGVAVAVVVFLFIRFLSNPDSYR